MKTTEQVIKELIEELREDFAWADRQYNKLTALSKDYLMTRLLGKEHTEMISIQCTEMNSYRNMLENRLNDLRTRGKDDFIPDLEPKYYIKFPYWFDTDYYDEEHLYTYLNVNRDTLWWSLGSKTNDSQYQTQFTQGEIDELQQNSFAKGLDLNELKIEVPYNEIDLYSGEELTRKIDDWSGEGYIKAFNDRISDLKE